MTKSRRIDEDFSPSRASFIVDDIKDAEVSVDESFRRKKALITFLIKVSRFSRSPLVL